MATYGSEVGVESINAHLTGGYTASTQPTSTQVGEFLTYGYSRINSLLRKAGYDSPVPSAATCYDDVVYLNNLFAAALAEEAHAVAPSSVDGEGRSARLWAEFKDGMGALLSGDLTQAGVSRLSSAPAAKSMRSRGLRRRDGYAHRLDPNNSEYATSKTVSLDDTLLEWSDEHGGRANEPDGY